jgi:hypothetical protein
MIQLSDGYVLANMREGCYIHTQRDLRLWYPFTWIDQSVVAKGTNRRLSGSIAWQDKYLSAS